MVYGMVGWKNTGKAVLVDPLVTEFTSRGSTVSTIRRRTGRESHRDREAGAAEVLLSAPWRWAPMHELRGRPEADIGNLPPEPPRDDLALLAGYRRHDHPKVETCRPEVERPPLAPNDPTIAAMASKARHPALRIPAFELNGNADIVNLVPSGAEP